MIRDPELAADLTQDAFVKAYRAYDTLEKPENARAWLYQIAHRVALDHIRRQKIVRFLPWTGESRGAVPSAEHLVMEAHLSGDLQRALERIPERQRAALLLAELHDLTGLELAAALGVSHVAARALLTRARESLRQALAAERLAEAERRHRGHVGRQAMSVIGGRGGRHDDWSSATRPRPRRAAERLDGPLDADESAGSTNISRPATTAPPPPPTTPPSGSSCEPCATGRRSRPATCGPGPPRRSSTRPVIGLSAAAIRAGRRCARMPSSPVRWSWPSPSGHCPPPSFPRRTRRPRPRHAPDRRRHGRRLRRSPTPLAVARRTSPT